MVDHILPLNFSPTTITVFIIFFIWSASNGYAYDYDKCSSTWLCGNVTNIGFPFLWPGRPPYCGHPDLQLRCPHNQSNDYYPVLQFDDPDDVGYLSFQVLAIWNTNSSFTTIKLLHMQPKSACPIDFKYNTFDDSLFKYSSNVSLTSFMECLEQVHNNTIPASDSITCSDSEGHHRWAYYLLNQSGSHSPDDALGYEDCNRFQAPLLTEELNKLQHGNETLEVALSKGFDVDLDIKYSEACVKCINSGGHCGQTYSDQLTCFCKDHMYINVCSKSGEWKLRLMLGLGIFFCTLSNLALSQVL